MLYIYLSRITYPGFFRGRVFVNLGLIILNSQCIEKDLTAARNEIHHLKGFLPICSHCKKTRDDHGYWNQLEEYISLHADVAFSHGICPECTEKFYNDYSSMDEREKNQNDPAD